MTYLLFEILGSLLLVSAVSFSLGWFLSKLKHKPKAPVVDADRKPKRLRTPE